MKRRIAATLAAVAASVALAGCTAEELVDFAGPLIATAPPSEPVAVATPTETTEAIVVEPTEPAAPAESEPSEGWQPGDEVWWVLWDPEAGGWPYPGVVLGTCDDHLIISWGWNTEGEQVLAPTSACFRSYEEAWASTGKTVAAGEDCG